MTESDKNSPNGSSPSNTVEKPAHNEAPALSVPVPAVLAKSASPLVAVLLLLIAMLSLQGGASLAKTLFPVVGPQGVTALRLGIGSLILLAWFRPWRMKIRGGNLKALLIYGLALGSMNYSFYLAIQTIPLGVGVALEFTGPLAVAMFSSRRPVDFIWVLLAVIGLWFLLPLGHATDSIDLKGACLALFAGTCWAIYILAGQRAGSSYGPGTAALGSLIGALVFFPIGAFQAHSSIFALSILPLGLLIALLTSAVPYSLEMIAMTKLPAKTFGTLMSMEPAMAALSGIIFLGEFLTGTQWLALVAIIAASAGSTLTIQRKTTLETVDIPGNSPSGK